MVKLLIDSVVTRYIEFKKVSRLLTPIDKTADDADPNNCSKFELVEVPCTRSDIFRSSIVSTLEKRYLMSFLEKCYRLERHRDWYRGEADLPFSDFLQRQTLTPKLCRFVVNTLLMDSDTIPTEQALSRINYFLRCFGRFCDRPFLFPMYGSEDVLQAFCRYGAVWGVVYCLGLPIRSAILDDQNRRRCSGVKLDGDHKINCHYLVTDYRCRSWTNESENASQNPQKLMSRAIILSTKSIKSTGFNEAGSLSFVHLPPDFTGHRSVYCFETDASSRVCPRYFFVQYLWCESTGDARHDLAPVIEKLFSSEEKEQSAAEEESELPSELRSRVVMLFYYQHRIESPPDTGVPESVFLISPAINELDYDFAVEEAERIFKQMYPEEEFFPQTSDSSESQQNKPNEEGKDDEDDEFLADIEI